MVALSLSQAMNSPLPFDPPHCYAILVKGRLDRKWAGWFDEMALSHVGDNTLLQGSLPDQSALYGLLSRLSDLGMTLLSVNVLEQDSLSDPQSQAHQGGDPAQETPDADQAQKWLRLSEAPEV